MDILASVQAVRSAGITNLALRYAKALRSVGITNWTTCLGVTVFIGVVKFFLTTPINPVTLRQVVQLAD